MDKNQIRTKKDDARYAKVWALSERYEQVTHSRAPLDSTAIYPTNRSPNYTMRPVRRKPYQDHTFALRIFHLSLMMTILSTSRWNAFLDCSWLVKSCELLPPYSIMGEPFFRHIFTYPWSHKRCQASSIWSLLDAHLELALWLDLPQIISSFFIEMMSWS